MDGELDQAVDAAAKRIKDLEALVMVYEATMYCLVPILKNGQDNGDWYVNFTIDGQVKTCAEAHREINGEDPMWWKDGNLYIRNPRDRS